MSFNGENMPWMNKRRIVIVTLFIVGVVVSCWALYDSADPFKFFPSSLRSSLPINCSQGNNDANLYRVLKRASMEDKTVIITTLNEAWAEPNSLLDLFLESFRNGNGTIRLLNHVVIVSLDKKAHARCLSVHPHCHKLNTTGDNFSDEAYFMTPSYLQMMWKRIDFLTSVLQMGFNFVFTDADILWLQDPFHRFYPDADFQIACDRFRGDPNDKNNWPNGGFNYVKSNNRTILFYKFWYSSRLTYPHKHDQEVLNKIKKHSFISQIGLKMMFLDTAYFGGFCEHGKDFNLVCTMHANCCYGLSNKIHDLKIVLEDWRRFSSLTLSEKAKPSSSSWRAPQNCSLTNFHPPKAAWKNP